MTYEGYVSGKFLFLAQYRFTALVQRISNCDEIQNKNPTSDKVVKYPLSALMISGRLKKT